jgi:hypothetical protein
MRGVFNLFGHDLPRFKPGRPIPTKKLNAALEAIERSRPGTGPGSGLSITQLPNGFAFRATNPGGPRLMTVTTDIPALSGTTAGKGAAQDCEFVVGTAALTAGSGTAVDVYSYHSVLIPADTIIETYSRFGVLWAADLPTTVVAYGTVSGSPISGGGGTGTITVISGWPADFTAVLEFTGSLSVGVKVYCALIAGTWHIISADCS